MTADILRQIYCGCRKRFVSPGNPRGSLRNRPRIRFSDRIIYNSGPIWSGFPRFCCDCLRFVTFVTCYGAGKLNPTSVTEKEPTLGPGTSQGCPRDPQESHRTSRGPRREPREMPRGPLGTHRDPTKRTPVAEDDSFRDPPGSWDLPGTPRNPQGTPRAPPRQIKERPGDLPSPPGAPWGPSGTLRSLPGHLPKIYKSIINYHITLCQLTTYSQVTNINIT